MKRAFIVLVGLFCIATAEAQQKDSAHVQSMLSATPLSFEPNVGQNPAPAKFTARGGGYSLELRSTGATFRFAGRNGVDPRAVTMDLAGASSKAEIQGNELLPGTVSYSRTSDTKTWFKNIPTYKRVHYAGVYPGIDMSYYGNGSRVEFDFIVTPGADPSRIRMRLDGGDKMTTESGDVVFALGKGDFRLLKPVAYQIAGDGKREIIDAEYRLQMKEGRPAVAGFKLGQYDKNRELIIDPVAVTDALSFSEYTAHDYLSAVALDSSGNSYLTGYNDVSPFGFWVSKFNTSGVLQWTHVVGTSSLFPLRIAVDSSNNVDVSGQTTSTAATLPTNATSYQTTDPASYTAFLVQVNSGGTGVNYATFLSGTDTYQNSALGMAVDSSGDVYLSGYTESATFPTTTGAYKTTFTGSPGANYEGFVAKFNPAAATASASLVYSTLLGNANSELFDVAVDSAGKAYTTGFFSNSTFPVTPGAFQYTGYDSSSGGVYVVTLNPTGTGLVYAAYLGYGNGYGIAVDGSGDAYVTGTVGYSDWPTTPGAYQTSYDGGFAVELNPSGSSEIYSTFLGGPSSIGAQNDVIPSYISIPPGCVSSCNVYVSGWTNTSDFPMINAVDSTSAGASNGFLVELAGNGASALLSSYFNGTTVGTYEPYPVGQIYYGFTPGIAVDGSGNVTLAGDTSYNYDFPLTIASSYTGTYLARLVPSSAPFLDVDLSYPNQIPPAIHFTTQQPVGVSTSVNGDSQTVKLRNLSATPATFTTSTTPPDIFTESDSCGGTIVAGGYCTMTVNFTPGQPGARTGSLSVAANGGNTVTIALNGTGYDTGWLTTSATSLSFGNQIVNTASGYQSVTLTNIGDESTAIGASLGNGTNYSLLNACPSQLASGAKCVVSVKFDPTQPGALNDNLSVSGGNSYSIPLSGTGIVSGNTGALTPSTNLMSFGDEAVGQTTGALIVSVRNTGDTVVSFQSVIASGDFAVTSQGCPINNPSYLDPQSYCNVYVDFTPTAAGTRTGTLTFNDSAGTQTVNLTGTGLAAVQNMQFYPATTVLFPNTPVGVASSTTLVYAENTGTAPITVDRILATGPFQITSTDCSGYTIAGTTNDGVSSTYGDCYAYVEFIPNTTGFLTGTITFVDNATGSPQTVNLQGNGIAPTGNLQVYQTQLDYSAYLVGTTSPVQLVELVNPGNSTVTVTGYNTGVSDFAASNYNCGAVPFALGAGGGCYLEVSFTPTSATNPRTGTLTINSTGGNQTVALSGTGVTASQALGMTPASPLNLGTIVDGTTSGDYSGDGALDGATGYGGLVSIRNSGTQPITFTANAGISGTNATEFSIYNPNACGNTNTPLAAGASCVMWVDFTPSGGASGAQTATLTFTDSAPGSPHTLTLNGTAELSALTYELTNYEVSFDNQVPGTTSAENTYIRFINNSGASLTMGNVQFTGPFLNPSGTCNGATVANGSTCYVYIEFSPTSAGYQTGTVTFVNNSNTVLVSAPLNGYAPAEVDSWLLNPTTLNFGTDQVVGTTSSYLLAQLTNTGNATMTIGAGTGPNFGAAPTNEFSFYSDGCSNRNLAAGALCNIYVEFTPNAAGSASATLNYPVTYLDGGTATVSLNLTGVAVAEVNSATASPMVGNFTDQTVGTTSSNDVTISLTNNGNRPLTVGLLTGTNTIVGTNLSGEFSTSSGAGGVDNCTHATVQPGSTCGVRVAFTPTSTGVQSGSLTFPVTYFDNTTANPSVTFTGTGVASGLTVAITPGGLNFDTQVVNTISAQQVIQLTNTGNAAINIGTDPFTGQFTLGPNGDGCANRALGVGGVCNIYVEFVAPSTPGPQTGSLTIGDNAAGGPHTLALSGLAIATAQQVALSTTSINFSSQPAGSNSAPEVVYLTNQGGTTISGLTGGISGANPSSFTLNTSNCGTSIGAQSSCYYLVTFTPGASASGAQNATLAVNFTGSAGAIDVSLSGTATGAAPAVTIAPSPMTFPIQNVGTTSAVQRFTVTNTGSAALTVATVASSNPTEFTVVSDGCSGATVAAGSFCTVGVTFSPSLGGTRSSTITITDNAGDSPETLSVAGTGFGIPQANLSPGTEPFGSVNLGSSSSQKTITLSNNGTDTLNIASITLTSGNTGDFSIPTGGTCGTTLAPGGSCTIFALFTPTVAGARGAALTVTDNATNLAGSTQSVTLSGTGVAIPQATVTGGPLAFGNQNLDTTSTARSVTVTNGGTGALSITSIVTSGPYAESDNCGQSLPAGGNCKISVLFTPTTAGAQPGSVTITDNASGSPQIVTLSGAGVGVPNGTAFTPTALTFADQNVGTTSADQTVTFSNSGTGTLTFASVAITQTSTDFAIDAGSTTCGATLAAGSSCTVAINFTPATGGGRIGTLVFTDNAGNVSGSSQSVALTGNGIGVPQATTNTGTLTYTSQNVGVVSAPQSVTLTNGGTGALKISSVSVGGTNSTDFIVSGGTCGTSLAIGANCTISVEFDPQGTGARTATLLISDNATNTASTQSVTLKGTGAGVPTATVTPTTITFANDATKTQTAAKLVTISNTGSEPLALASIAGLTGTPFNSVNNCGTLPANIAPGASCVVAIGFKPTAVGNFSATLTITDNTGNVSGSTQAVTVKGTSDPTGGLSPNLTFAAQTVGTTSAAQTVTLTNTGVDKLTITSISGVSGTAFGGADPNDFLSPATTCSIANGLGVGKSCTISVEFKPKAKGNRTATLIVTDNSGGNGGTTQSVTLTGTGH